MVLCDEDIIKFQSLYERHFGIEISKEDAREQGMKLVHLLMLVCEKPCKEDSVESKLKNNNQ